MWPELRDQIKVEQEQLRQLFEMHRSLLDQCRLEEPDLIQLSALGAFLHSFYTGTENLFRRVAVELGDDMPRGDIWHQRLLQEMAEATENRSAVISADLRDRLKPYLQFRHVFRQAYTFQLHWQKMAPLVGHCEELLEQLQRELTAFVLRTEASQG